MTNENLQNQNTPENLIFKCRKIRESLNHKDKNLLTYLSNLKKVLDIFGYKDLRPNQKDAVYELMKGEDLLFVTETGGGKSAIYITVGLSMGLKTIIFSPLISLIQDQVEKLKSHGIRVGALSSAVTQREKNVYLNLWENDELDFLFVAPERLQNQDFRDKIKEYPPDFIVVDEIHCAYEHSDNFRPSYKQIAPFIEEVNPKLFLGLTATMSKDVEASVRQVFNLQNTKKIVRSYTRDNLHYYSHSISEDNINLDLLHLVNAHPQVPTIVYFSTVKLVKEAYNLLSRSIQGGCMAYTGQMDSSSRESNQNNFINGNIRVAFATNSFGMGIDKPDVGKVIFRTMPGSLEELTQGFGRGGRNGCRCDCILMGDINSLNTQKFFIDTGFPDEDKFKQFYKALTLLANEEKQVYKTLESISMVAKIDPIYSSAITRILQGFNVIKRDEKNDIGKIKFIDVPDDDCLDKKLKSYYEKISLLGLEDKDYLSIDLTFLSQELGVTRNTVLNNLKAFDKLGIIEFIPPGRPPLIITGNLSDIDFSYLADKKEEKEQKLNEVLNFYKLEDSKKSMYLSNYFNTLNG